MHVHDYRCDIKQHVTQEISSQQWYVNEEIKRLNRLHKLKTWQHKDQIQHKCMYKLCLWRKPTSPLLLFFSLKLLWFFCVYNEERRGLSNQSKVIARPVCTRPAISTLIKLLLKEFYNYKIQEYYFQTQLMSCVLPFSLKRSPVQSLKCLPVKRPFSFLSHSKRQLKS